MAKLIYSSGPGLARPKQKMPTFDTSTPEGAFSQGIAIKKRDFQKHYKLERDTIIRRGRAKKLDNRQINQYLDQLNTNADRKALELKQEEEIGLIRVRNIKPSALEQRFQEVTKLEAGGTMSPEQAREARTRMKIGPTAASVLYRKPEKPEDPLKALDRERTMIDRRLADFRVKPGTDRSSRLGLFGRRVKKPSEIQILDPSLYGTDKEGNITTGNWRKASKIEAEERLFFENKKARNMARTRMAEGQGGPLIRAHLADPRGGDPAPEQSGGSMQDQAKKYIENKQTQQEPEDFGTMSIEELRRITEGR
ncbi:hypothetical protein LCGC14_1230200 [marine sediment metagenome]|uniref:Uncharacterized protein n=1 Tax=marine sediment metagenome TaxID=412755 RepID=A0A0F9LCX8_9ZZZZ